METGCKDTEGVENDSGRQDLRSGYLLLDVIRSHTIHDRCPLRVPTEDFTRGNLYPYDPEVFPPRTGPSVPHYDPTSGLGNGRAAGVPEWEERRDLVDNTQSVVDRYGVKYKETR